MKKIILFTLLSLPFVNFCLISVYANENENNNLIKIVQAFKPLNSVLISPEKPFSTYPIQLYDFNKDGQKEIIFTFEIKAIEQPSPSQYGTMVLKKDNGIWRKVWETKVKGVALNFSGLVDITGDGTKEYLFGVTNGAAIGSELGIFKWAGESFEKITNIPYHKMDIIHVNQKVGIAIWQMYIGDSYLVNVLNWNGEKLVNDEALFNHYYPKIETFYQNKITKMDAWFYWYCLADAQIKANKLEDASTSIQKGISLAKKLSMSEAVQDFINLTECLKAKANKQ
ncbi:hypothetical protein [Lysinibacillus sp. FW12]|uniref:hypothetical protein n=1 Tax=Lysinibacillus sp. FW12 TaxID=3096079 RepID=UPI003D752D0F